ncbi:MAG: hypothetical protein IJZ94_04730 [Clostridia bacterium]|nr:hypothetical protein [Clostridia bacterium]MBQ8165101.1 hypothetical protein [Clostridia bacterium]
MSKKRTVKQIIRRVLNAVLIIGMIVPMAYYLYIFTVKYIERSETASGFVSAVFSTWTALSGMFLKLAFISAIFIVIKLLSLLPLLFSRIKVYHRGTDVQEIVPAESFDEIKNIKLDDFIRKYKEVMYDAERTAALLPVVLYAISSGNPDSDDIVNFITNRASDNEMSLSELKNIKKQLEGKEYIALSYFTCTTPENGYEVSGVPTTRIKFSGTSGNDKDEKTLYIACSGSGSYRPIKLKAISPKTVKKSKNTYIAEIKTDDMIWIFDEFSASLVNVKTYKQ